MSKAAWFVNLALFLSAWWLLRLSLGKERKAQRITCGILSALCATAIAVNQIFG